MFSELLPTTLHEVGVKGDQLFLVTIRDMSRPRIIKFPVHIELLYDVAIFVIGGNTYEYSKCHPYMIVDYKRTSSAKSFESFTSSTIVTH